MIRFLTSGESHGKILTGILEGMPSGIEIQEDYINRHLARRQTGYGRSGRMKQPDTVDLVSGLYKGKTSGSPITCIIRNQSGNDWLHETGDSHDVYIPRPGHADFTGLRKYRLDNIRPVIERASARETAMRTALGAIALKFLEEFSIRIISHVIQIGPVRISDEWLSRNISIKDIVDKTAGSRLNVIDPDTELFMMKQIDQSVESGDSLGGIIELIAEGLPAGLGSYQHPDRRLTGLIMGAVGSIPAVKGVEVGEGFMIAKHEGSRAQDEFLVNNGVVVRTSNRCGGLEGGMTNGQSLIIRAAMKPIPTIRNPLSSFDIRNLMPAEAHYERADTCAVPAFGVIAESVLALTLVNPFLEKYGGDSLEEIKERFFGDSHNI